MYQPKASAVNTLKRMGILGILSVFALTTLLTFAMTASASSSAAISNFKIAPQTFNPDVASTVISFDVNQDGRVGLEIDQGTKTIKVLALREDVDAGHQVYQWDGKDRYGNLMPAGNYYVKLIYFGETFTKYETDITTIDYSVSPDPDPDPDPDPIYDVITNDYASPYNFNPNLADSNIIFTLTEDVTALDVLIEKNGVTIVELVDHDLYPADEYYVPWNGRDQYNQLVEEGTYNYKIYAQGDFPSETETGLLKVDYPDTDPDPDPDPEVDAPNISNAYLTKDNFDPSEGETTTLWYTLDTCADVDVKLFNASTGAYIKTLQNPVEECTGDHHLLWDGKASDGSNLPQGEYLLRITADNDGGSDLELEFADIVNDDFLPSLDLPNVYGLSLTRDEISPDLQQITTLSFSVDTCANLTVKLYDENDNLIRLLVDDVYRCADEYQTQWDGEYSNNVDVPDGYYYFKVYASNSYGSDSEREYIRVDSYNNDDDDDDDDDDNCNYDCDDDDDDDDGADERPRITDVDVDPEVFDPFDEDAELEFELNTCAYVTIEVRDEDNDLVYEIIDDKWLCDGQHDYDWDGEDEDNDKVRQDEYEFYIRAENSYGSDVERIDVEVDYNSHSYDEGERCAGYRDVSVNDPYCDAIEYVSTNGIFDGYPDGMFRPYQAINRAETTKVILRGFNYPMLSADGTNLGFWDVEPQAWYMQYLRTGLSYNIIQGYPDGSFQPARTVNRVELLKIFLESANVATPQCDYAPYPDTPIQADTEWYMPYVCYAKTHNLMDPDYRGNFNPAKPMTRGDVATLFARFADMGLIGNANDYSYLTDPYYYDYLGNDPRLTNVELDDDSVEEGDSVRIYFDLNTTSYITVQVLDDDGDVVRELADDVRMSPGERIVYFNGDDDDGDELREGDYEIRVVARNSYGSDQERLDLEIGDGGSSNLNAPRLTDVRLSDDDFEEGDSTTIYYDIDTLAYLTVLVLDDNNEVVRELADDLRVTEGEHIMHFNGDDDDGDDLEVGDYEIKLIARNSYGTDREELEFEIIDNDNDGYMNVYSLSISDSEFDPDSEELDISFRLNRPAEVTVRVYDEDNDLVRELWDEKDVSDGRYILEWDGEDDDYDEVSNGTYTIKVLAETSLDDDEEEIEVEVVN